ncbi:MAG: hypothetical protein FJW64_11695 [Actinobacteria bacterium]|nr:hypothetical protein [Actinomycetota bacterium]
MHRLIVALLAAFDAALAAAGGIAVVLAPLALLWVVGLGDPDWTALWPAAASVWHLGHLVPITVTLPDAYLAATGIDPALATFTLSLAPLAFAVFTGLFAARSGVRAAEAGAAVTGWLSGSAVFAGLTALIAVSSGAPLVASETWQAILFPALLFAVPALLGAIVGSWRVGDEGPIDALRVRLDDLPEPWGRVPALIARGLGVSVLGVVSVGALVVVVGLVAGSTQIIALFQAMNVDAVGATVIALAQLTFLPTLVVWGLSFAAGPGFAVGTDTAVTPAGTQVGVLPGIPVLGAVPETTTPWLLLLVLLPMGVGALTGWILRAHLPATRDPEPVGPRLTVAIAVAALTGGAGALLAVLARGSMGPGRLADTGPEPGPLALTLGLEVFVGLAILLLSPRVGAPVAELEPARPAATRTPVVPRSLFDPHTGEHPVVPARPGDDRTRDAADPAPSPGPSGIGSDVDHAWPTAPVPRVDAGPTADTADLSDDEVRARIRDAWASPEWGRSGDEPRDR